MESLQICGWTGLYLGINYMADGPVDPHFRVDPVRYRAGQAGDPQVLPEAAADPLPPPPRNKPVSEARRRASVANGRRSKGPTTPEGKRASSRNSLKHGLYQKELAAIPRGPFAEVAKDIEAFIEVIVSDLRPQNAIQDAMALGIAQAFVQEGRIQKVEASLLAQVTAVESPEWIRLSNDLDAARALVEFLEDPERERLGPWQVRLVDFIVTHTEAWVHPQLTGTPPNQLTGALDRLGGRDAAKEWAVRQVVEIETQLADQAPWDVGRAAEFLVAEMAKLGALATQSTRNLNRRLAVYRKLQETSDD